MGRLGRLSQLYPRGKSGKYKPAKAQKSDLKAQSRSHQWGSMAGRYRQTIAPGDGGPPQKKRKTETEEDEELWDDSMEFSQVDLEDLDREVQASQAMSKQKVEDTSAPSHSFPLPSASTSHAAPVTLQASRSTGHVNQPSRDTTGKFLKPQLSRSASSSSSSLTGSHVTSHSAQNSSSHSSSRSIHSSYPSSFSDSHSSSISIRSGSSSDHSFPVVRRSGSLSRGISAESLDESGIIGRQHLGDDTVTIEGHQQHARDQNQPSRDQNQAARDQHQKEIEKLKQQLDKLQEEVCVRDGENKLLRDNLTRRDSEIDQLKMEKINQINQQNKQQSQKEKNLQNELSKLQTQLQFKHQEEREMADKCRELEAQVKHMQPLASSSQVPPMTETSPKPRRVPVDDRSPKGASQFPTTQSFLSTETVSPVKKALPREKEIKPKMVSVATGSCERLPMKNLSLKLKVSKSAATSGSYLVAKLLDVSPTLTGSLCERGIVGLLNMPSTTANLYSMKFDRDRDTSLLSPVANKRLSDFHSLISQCDSGETVGLTEPEHFNMAVRGLTQLLRNSDNPSAGHRTGEVTPEQEPQPMLSRTSQGKQSPDREYIFGESDLDSAILILPLIYDYLQHYIEIYESVLESNNNTSLVAASSKSSSPESFDTSSESPTGSLGVLLRTTANYANDLESLAIASLHTLNLLVTCEGVREVLLRNFEVETPTQNPSNLARGGQLARCGSKAQQFPLKTVCKCNILRGIIRLSNPGSKGHLYNTRIVVSSLSILKVLTHHARTDQINRLLPVLSEECIQNCLECETEPTIVVHALQVLKALAKSNLVVSSLCTNTSGCVLLSVYGLSVVDKCLTAMNVEDKLPVLHLIIELLSYIASCHKGGLTVILESDCQCSVEVVKTIVCTLHSVLRIHKENKTVDGDPASGDVSVVPSTAPRTIDSVGRDKLQRTSLELLRDGLLLLHLLYQHDAGFSSRHSSVQHQYVQLICGLSHIIKPMENNEFEMNALQDLWDYAQDDSELYPSDEENRSMDTSD